MKKCIFVAMTALLASCSEQQLADSIADVKSTELVQTSDDKTKFNALVEKARWGDGQAFLQLADCYRDGVGVEKDFLGMMCMVMQADALRAIESEKDYLSRLSEDNEYKQCYNLMDRGSSEIMKEKDSIMTILNAIDSPDALAVSGIVYVECGDTIGGFETIGKAADNGSNFASILLTVANNNGELSPDKNKLEQVADKNPVAYKILGGIYRDLDENDDFYNRKAALCYLEAEKHALLDRGDVAWLLFYYRNGGDIQLTDEDIRRLETFSDVFVNKRKIVVADTICLDSVNQ